MKKRLIYAVAALLSLTSASQQLAAQNTSPFWSLAGNSNASTTTKIGTTNAVDLKFMANNIERIRILSSNGNVGIGTLTPTERLRINGPVGINPLRVQVNGHTKFMLDKNGGAAIGLSLTPPQNGLYVEGNVGLGVKVPTARLEIAGPTTDTRQLTLLKVTRGNVVVDNEFGTGDNFASIYGRGGIGVSGEGMTGVFGIGMNGVFGTGYVGVRGIGNEEAGGTGVSGISNSNGVAVDGYSQTGYGGVFTSISNTGLVATGGGTYAAEFRGQVFASNGFVASDGNLKQNVTEFDNAMSILGKLKPRNYDFKKEAKYGFLHLPEGRHYGLLAQDVEEVLPNLVSTANHADIKRDEGVTQSKPRGLVSVTQKQKPEFVSIKAVNYVELIPIIIKAMQELNEKNKEIDVLKERIDKLEAIVQKLNNDPAIHSTIPVAGYLEQNSPNPVNGSTTIRYHLGESTGIATIAISNIKGQVLKSVALANGVSGQLNVNTNLFAAGTYNYTLYMDGKMIDSKRFVIAR